jgi:hypothetical protein
MYYKTYKPHYYQTPKQEHNGYLYDSKFEAKYGQELELRLKAGDIKGFERQKNIDLIVNGYVVCQYRVDFVVFHNDETIEYVELKGYATDVFKLKWKLFDALYGNLPDVKLTIIYQGKNWRPKLRKVKI